MGIEKAGMEEENLVGPNLLGLPCLLQRIQDIGVDSVIGEYNSLANIATPRI